MLMRFLMACGLCLVLALAGVLGVAGFGDLGAITVRAIDPDVERMLRPYRIAVVA